MIAFVGSAHRRRRLVADAARSRAFWARRLAAALAVVIYNVVGVADIYSTVLALEIGAGEEANPFVRAMMDHAGDGWVIGKLALQGVISIMVLWFPHWIVIGFFSVATLGNMWVVYNNLAIAGVF
ncbi:MAG: DUF5658 family protein [Pseudomonadota bacterium]